MKVGSEQDSPHSQEAQYFHGAFLGDSKVKNGCVCMCMCVPKKLFKPYVTSFEH